ncbi:hypothetical protein [Oceanobacillus kapialis]|uniref:hypothetical protein n=1 Tax=Oceanobacillus kapialis TaxID=481353 RepID=UPI00384CDB5E
MVDCTADWLIVQQWWLIGLQQWLIAQRPCSPPHPLPNKRKKTAKTIVSAVFPYLP